MGATDLHFEQARKGCALAIVELTHCKLWQEDNCLRSISITYSWAFMAIDEMNREYWRRWENAGLLKVRHEIAPLR